MSVAQHDNSYLTEAKKGFREYVYSLVTPDNCSVLVDDAGNLQYKWLELIGDNANTFDQLLSTGKINESQLIGLDRRDTNIERCRTIYPKAEFYGGEWVTFCREYKGNDIGVIVFDSFNAGYGKNFNMALTATLQMATECSKQIGECLVVVNVDSSKTYRSNAKGRGLTARDVLKETIEDSINSMREIPHHLRSFDIDINVMHEYRQSKTSTKMVCCGFLI
jgi:hypothetical protein